jgi:hypothetical protein
MNTDKWNEICFLLSENIKSDINESAFEQNVIQALRVLGWKQFSGDFDIRPSYQIGAANRITPDFVIKTAENTKLFVIEIKQPSIPLTSNFQQQLFSYMRQLKLEYGILIGQGIQIFYDGNLAEQEDPVLLEMIHFEKNSQKGEKFVEIFSKENFNPELLQEFTLNALKKINHKEELKKLKNQLLSESYRIKIFDILKTQLLNDFDEKIIDKVFNELEFNIEDKIKIAPIENYETRKTINHLTADIFNTTIGKLPIGKYVQKTFSELVASRLVDRNEIERLQRADYSKTTFGIQFPFLAKENSPYYERIRYWKNTYIINGEMYFVCSQWYEVPANNDRPYYEKWLKNMKKY